MLLVSGYVIHFGTPFMLHPARGVPFGGIGPSGSTCIPTTVRLSASEYAFQWAV